MHKFIHACFVISIYLCMYVDSCTTQSYYYLGFFYNYNGGSQQSLILTTTDSQPVSYSLYIPRLGDRRKGKLMANDSVILSFSSMEVSSYSHINYGIYLETSSDKVTVIGQSYTSHTSDTYLALPTIKSESVTEYVYYAMSVNSPNSQSSILIVSTEDSTVLKLTTTQSTTIYRYSSYYYRYRNLSPGYQYSTTVNRLQTTYMQTSSDLSGTKIVTNKPVSVFTGHRCAQVPYGYGNCGYMIEQIPPTTFWGTTYYTAPLATKSTYTIKVLAAYDNTKVTIYCNGTTQSYSLNEKSHITKTLDNQEYCTIYANNKVLVAQFSGKNGEDPSMTLVPATNNFMSKFKFSTFRHSSESYYFPTYVNIIIMAQYYQPDLIHLTTGDLKASLATQEWTPFTVNNITESYATRVTVFYGEIEIVHTNIATLMTVMVYGVAARNGYMHPVGLPSTVGKFTYCNT